MRDLPTAVAKGTDPSDGAPMALLEQLEVDPGLHPDQPDRIVYRGRIGPTTIRVALAQDGRAHIRVVTGAESVLRFATRAQLPQTKLRTGDASFDAQIGMLGNATGLIRVGADARSRIAAWLAQPRRWATDSEAGAADVPPDDLEAVVSDARALLKSLAPPEIPELLQMRATAPEPLASLIDQRLKARLPRAKAVLPILHALEAHATPTRLRWLEALGGLIDQQPKAVLALLPDPAPPRYDQHCVRWAAHHPQARTRLKAIAAASDRRRPLLAVLQGHPEDLRTLLEAMPHDADAVADIEANRFTPRAARLARIEALAERPAGDPRAWRQDAQTTDPTIRAAVSEALQRHLPVWLGDPRTAVLALGELGLAESNADLLIAMVDTEPTPGLVMVLADTAFAQPMMELRRLRVLADSPGVPPFDLSAARASSVPAIRVAAEVIIETHLANWLSDPTAAKALQGIGPLDASLKAKVLATCQRQPCPGAVQLLASFEFRAESDRIALVAALALSGSPRAESPLLKLMASGYAVRLACVEGLAQVGGKASLKALQDIASGFFVEKALKETAQRSIAQIEARLGGGMGSLSMAQSSLDAGGRLSLKDD